MSDRAIIVDKDDNILDYKTRDERKPGDINRITALWLEDGKGNVLLAKRSMKKKHDPGVWGPAASGTVQEGETYEQNMYLEAEEEIGLTGVKFVKLGKKLYMRHDGTGRYVTFYKGVVDKPADQFALQQEEVEQVKWISREALLEDLRKNRKAYTPSNTAWEYFLHEKI